MRAPIARWQRTGPRISDLTPMRGAGRAFSDLTPARGWGGRYSGVVRPLSLLLALFLSACGLKRMLPEGPVLKEREREALFAGPEASGATYTSDANTHIPALPMTVWGIGYDLDIVVVTDHPEWDMTEIARIDTEDGPVWMAKDARRRDLTQMLITDLSDRQDWIPEIPVQRIDSPVRVEDRSTETDIDIDIFYTNADGQPVAISYQGKVPQKAQRQRNGSTMGHSQDDVIAVLDLPLRDFARSARVRIGGEEQRIAKLAGLIPFTMALTQTQAGIARTDVVWTALPPPFPDAPINAVTSTYTMSDQQRITQEWQLARTETGVSMIQRDGERTLQHDFVGDDSLEWTGASVRRVGRELPVMQITAQPALPDLRRRFDGAHTSRFVIDVAGQRSHATGSLTASWDGDQVRVQIRPDAPWWVAERPMDSVLSLNEDGTLHLHTARVPAP